MRLFQHPPKVESWSYGRAMTISPDAGSGLVKIVVHQDRNPWEVPSVLWKGTDLLPETAGASWLVSPLSLGAWRPAESVTDAEYIAADNPEMVGLLLADSPVVLSADDAVGIARSFDEGVEGRCLAAVFYDLEGPVPKFF